MSHTPASRPHTQFPSLAHQGQGDSSQHPPTVQFLPPRPASCAHQPGVPVRLPEEGKSLRGCQKVYCFRKRQESWMGAGRTRRMRVLGRRLRAAARQPSPAPLGPAPRLVMRPHLGQEALAQVPSAAVEPLQEKTDRRQDGLRPLSTFGREQNMGVTEA